MDTNKHKEDPGRQMEERLWDYIDGFCSDAERNAIGDLIAADPEWQDKYRELLEWQAAMGATELDAPSLRFTRNVMEEIARHRVAPATTSYFNRRIIGGIAAFFLLAILGTLVFSLVQLGGSGARAGLHHDQNNLPALGDASSMARAWQDRLDRIDWSRIFTSGYVNIFIMVSVVMGLMLLDMYLTRRKGRAGLHKAS
jgi:anti-sigma factor RsiW